MQTTSRIPRFKDPEDIQSQIIPHDRKKSIFELEEKVTAAINAGEVRE